MEDFVTSGDRVAGRFVYRGTHAGELMGIPASGNQVEMRSIDIWRVEDGMFAGHWDELNLTEMFQQMGALPPPGAGPDHVPAQDLYPADGASTRAVCSGALASPHPQPAPPVSRPTLP